MDSPDPNRHFFGPLTTPQPYPTPQLSGTKLGVGSDGTVDRLIKMRDSPVEQRQSMAVFIHAGAGYHSVQNENVHLTMCAKAAQEAMKCLKAGGSATDAVAAAIVVLENNDITNAGFGSNLSVNGTVECDATIVDHFGRSGACGAVPNIKNPISLAKLILDTSLRPLSLRRVPPNILVGEGAKRFAMEHGMPLAHNKELVSKNAVDRFRKWCDDLRRAQARLQQSAAQAKAQVQAQAQVQVQVKTETQAQVKMETASPEEAKYNTIRMPKSEKTGQNEALAGLQTFAAAMADTGLTIRDHSRMWNEGQPDSPSPSDTASPNVPNSGPVTPTRPSPLSLRQNGVQSPSLPTRGIKMTRALNGTDDSMQQLRAKRPRTSEEPMDTANGASELLDESWNWADHTMAEELFGQAPGNIDLTELTAEPADDADLDRITDTIGAIVIDGQGNMAAGSSSGGIGMKHMGRVGPAALVGIGTHVIPLDPDDGDARTVAAVTSGTGEHMATTMAAHKCADRLYHMTRAGAGGDDETDVPDEGAIMADFVTRDFMGHPGVRNQTSSGAIGVLAVKATRSGIYMHWAHNTDSFALAHMASYHKEPKCVMSRLTPGKGPVNIGAQKVLRDHAAGMKARD